MRSSVASDPIMIAALEAVRAHRDAQDGGASEEELERLKVKADFLYHAAIDFQLLGAGSLPESVH
ncbi:hypothetical protein D3C76_1050080 [compost metagenome]